jgi:ubiquinone/menaquinone biosynthesis C-methylase UbiE
MSTAKIDELIELLKLNPEAEVLDIACGKGEILTRLAEHYTITGVGVDISPFAAADAKQKLHERVPNGQIEILNMDGADYKSDKPFDVTMCIGASWIYKGHQGTLRAMKSMTKAGGLILVGEPFWIKEPVEAYLAVVSSQDDWDRYETLQWYAATKFAEENENDPDVPEILNRVAQGQTNYLRWGRDTLGWAIYLFKNATHII